MDNIAKPASYSKRICSAMIDFLIIVLCYFLISFLSTSVLNSTASFSTLKEEYNQVYQTYYDEAVEAKLIKYNEETGKFEYLEGITEECDEYKAFMERSDIIAIQKDLTSRLKRINTISFFKFLVDTLIVELIFALLIPLIRKDHASIGQIIMKLSLINRGDYKASKFQVFFRFLAMYLIETVFYYVFFGELLILVMPIVNLGFMIFNKHNITIHDFFANTKVVETEYSVIFENVQERNDYYIQKEIEDEAYRKQRSEQSKLGEDNE